MVDERIFIKPICPACKRKVVQGRIKTGVFVCRQCLTEFKWDNEKGEAYDIVVRERKSGVKNNVS